MSYVDDAKRLRPIIVQASESLPDDVAKDAVELFEAWSGDSVAYNVGDRVRHGEYLYKCVQAHTSQPDWEPNLTPALWVRVDDPSIEWPEWRQPVGALDSYMQGDKVSHNDKHWISDVDNNVWEPGVYGWTEAE